MHRVATTIFVLLALPLVAGAAGEFTRNLYFGMRADADVIRLQDFLRTRGYLNSSPSTGNYLGLTRTAVRQWQQAVGITPASGFFGPQSRAAANKTMVVGQSSPSVSGAGAPAPAITFSSEESPYRGKLGITSLYGSSNTAAGEYMEIENKSSQDRITITGFRIENAAHDSVTIPKGYGLPGFGSVTDPIVLEPGDSAVISMGKQERQINFRENMCTGYFDESSRFSPSLRHRCPRVQIPQSTAYNDQCIQTIEYAANCRMAQVEQFIGPACQAFIDAHMNYAGCVADSRGRPDFYSRRWLIWMQRDQEFFRDRTERVTLRDQQGKMVAEYSY